MLKLINFTKIYENNKVGAKDINLEVKPGDIFAFIGHNGAGKTTTIKSIVGILPITSGDILIDGLSITTSALECKKKIAYAEESAQLPKEEEKKVWCNLGMILFALGCIGLFVYSLISGYNA